MWLNAIWQAIRPKQQFIANQLMEQGITAIADKIGMETLHRHVEVRVWSQGPCWTERPSASPSLAQSL